MGRIDQTSIRRQNLQRIVDELVEHQPITRQELAQRTELSLMSVTNLVEQLSANGILAFSAAPDGADTRRVGRKAEYISLDSDRNAWLIVDLMDVHYRCVIMGLDGALRETGTPWPYDATAEYGQNLAQFLASAAERMAVAGAPRILGVAVVVPGPYDPESDTITNTRIPELNGIQIKALLREHIGDCPSYVDEDVKLAARASLAKLRGDPPEVMFYLYLGEGVSGALVDEGRVVRGLNAMAGEAGQTRSRDGRSYEQRLSRHAFAGVLARRLGLPAEETADHLAELRASRPDDYRAALNEVVPALAELLYQLCWLIDPNAVVIDCPWAGLHEGELMAMAREELMRDMAGIGKRMPELRVPGFAISGMYLGAADALMRQWIRAIA